MFTSFSIVCSWLESSRFITGYPVLSQNVSSPTLKLMLSWTERVWEPSGTFSVCVSTTGCPVLSCATSTLRLLLSSDERVWVLPVQQRVAPFYRFWQLFREKNVYRSPGNGTFSSILRGSRVSSNKWLHRSIGSNNGLLRSIMIWFWNWLVRLETFELLHNLSFWSLSVFWTQFSFPIMTQGDIWRKPRWHIYLLVYDFSSFHPNNFRNTISWKCIVKNDGVRSSLIELQSFLQSKIVVVPVHCVLMSLPCFMHVVLCMTRCIQIDRIKILMIFVHLWSVCRILRIQFQRIFWTSGISCSLLFKFITNLFDPKEILTQEWELSLFRDIILISTPHLPCKQQVATSNTGPILVFPWTHPFGCDASSSLGRVYSRQAAARNCENSAVSFVMKYCILHPYKICSICLVVIAFQFVLHTVAIEDLCEQSHHNPKALMSWSRLARAKNSIVLPQRVAPFYREEFRILHTFLRLLHKDWADLQRQFCKKNCLNRFQIGTIMYRHFSMSFAFELTSGQWTRGTENWMSAFREFQHHPLRHIVPFSLWTIFTDRIPLLFQNQDQWMTIVLFQIFLHTEIRVERLPDILLQCLLFHKKCCWTSTWI